ncbi:MAG: diguanylate cyclase [Chitinivibrionales bacterium]|nr:diguanylate cyclase [Chitinivibrionales bacterium]
MNHQQNSNLDFNGYQELIEEPLAKSDQLSLKRIKKLLADSSRPVITPFSFLLQRICGKKMPEDIAREKWRKIIRHKSVIESRLERTINIQTAAVDYFDMIQRTKESPESVSPFHRGNGHDKDQFVEQISSPGFYLEKLKEELRRARRYRHALSAILLNIDNFNEVIPDASNNALSSLVKIIKKTIRTVDILARYSEEKFVVILPNTNKREAQELADRLCKDIQDRSSRIASITGKVKVTASVGQCAPEDKSVEFMKRLDNMLKRGIKQGQDQVYVP